MSFSQKSDEFYSPRFRPTDASLSFRFGLPSLRPLLDLRTGMVASSDSISGARKKYLFIIYFF